MSEAPKVESLHSVPFSDMAARIERNADIEFGGAMVLVPPEGDPIELFIIDPKKDLGHFLSAAMTKLEIALNAFKESQHNSNAFGRR